METLSYEVNTLPSKTFPMEETYIIPLFDLHAGIKGFPKEKVKEIVSWATKKKNTYFIGGGDYFDMLPKSVMDKYRGSAIDNKFDNFTDFVDNAMEKNMEELMDVLKPTIGKWICMIGGNHHFVFSDGTTTDTRLAHYLQTRYCGTSAVIDLRFKGKSKEASTVLFVHHGRTSSNPIQALEKFSGGWDDVDIFLIGHNHILEGKKIERMGVTKLRRRDGEVKVTRREITLLSCGGFLHGYEIGSQRNGISEGNYVEKRMLRPLPVGTPYLQLKPRIKEGYPSVKVHVLI